MHLIRSKAPVAARSILGLLFLVFGLNGFLQFIPMQPPQGAAGQFLGGLFAAGYFFPLLSATQIVVGLMLVSGRWVPLALVVLAPITLHIAAFHVALAPDGLPIALTVLVLHVYLAWAYRDAFRGVLDPSARPRVAVTPTTVEQVPAGI